MACLSLLREPHAGRQDGETIEPGAKQAAEIAAIEGQEDVSRRQCTEQDRPVLVHGEHGGVIDRQHIIHENKSLSQSQPRGRHRGSEASQVLGASAPA